MSNYETRLLINEDVEDTSHLHKQILDEVKNIKWYIKCVFWTIVAIIILSIIFSIIGWIIFGIRRLF